MITNATTVGAPALYEFFNLIETSGGDRYFKPHPFTHEEAERIVNYRGKDIYLVMTQKEWDIVGYGMLRGWDEGFDIPSLGIAIHPLGCNHGLGRYFMNVLHTTAEMRGATKVRLTCHPDNKPAYHLYLSMGYEFQPQPDTAYHEGFKTL